MFTRHLPSSLSKVTSLCIVTRFGSAPASRAYSSQPLRALYFTQPGDPLQVVSARSFSPLPPPGPDEVQLRIRFGAINPSDLNVLQGVYPSKPRPRNDLGTPYPIFLPGNEGLGEVVQTGNNVSSEILQIGDRAVMGSPQLGTWSNFLNAKASSLIRVRDGVTDIQAATMSVSIVSPLSALSS
jgi:trans-2-enoyl-CoA reductase